MADWNHCGYQLCYVALFRYSLRDSTRCWMLSDTFIDLQHILHSHSRYHNTISDGYNCVIYLSKIQTKSPTSRECIRSFVLSLENDFCFILGCSRSRKPNSRSKSIHRNGFCSSFCDKFLHITIYYCVYVLLSHSI